MNPLTWLLANIDMTNQRMSKEVFKLLKLDMTSAEVLHIETNDIWRFNVERIPDMRMRQRTLCGIGDCNLPEQHVGGHRGSCGCINGCKASDCPNV